MEGATIILSVSVLIDEEKGDGPPRYYAVASGEADVVVSSIYMTKLDRVTCSANYQLVDNVYSNVNYQSCDVTCHEECLGGCNLPNDARFCMECKNHKLFVSRSQFDCIETCGDMPVARVIINGAVHNIRTGDIEDQGQSYEIVFSYESKHSQKEHYF